MRPWRFRSYCSPAGDLIRGWFEEQLPSVQAEIVNIAMYLRSLDDADDWVGKDYKDLTGREAGLGQLRIIVDQVHYRILGFRDDVEREFTMLYADRKTTRFDYKPAGTTAKKRLAEILADRAKFSCTADWILLP